MRTALDTNVLSALWSLEPTSSKIAAALDNAASGGLVICAVVYVELLAHPKATQAFVNRFLASQDIMVDFNLGERVWRDTALRFAKYSARRRQSKDAGSKRLLADFIVGSHALLHADRLFTLDQKVYSRDFPELKQTEL